MDKGVTGTVSLREKLGTLIRKLLKYMDKHKNTIFNFSLLVQEASNILKDLKRSLEILFYLEGLGIIVRVTEENVVFVGLRGMVRKFYEFQTDSNNARIIASPDRIIGGKNMNVKGYILGGNLVSNIFFTLIYERGTVTKSSVEQMVEEFMMQQKQLNAKNFVQDSLNILSNLGLIQKDESTESITYIGPDLRCYQQNGKKVNWKMYQVLKKQQQLLGKQIQERQQPIKKTIKNQKMPPQTHVSHFPQIGFAVLRSSNWEQCIKKSVFFIGRSQKKPRRQNQKIKAHQVDLQLPYKSVSRQHAMILYNSQAGKWQIRCLSRKNMIKVDQERIANGDKNVWIKNRTQITIGPEKMVFLEANPEYSQKQ